MACLPVWRNHPRRWIVVLSAFLSLVLVYHFLQINLDSYEDVRVDDKQEDDVLLPSTSTECQHLSGMRDILVVLKTGATEAQQKVPEHIETTLSCVPHYVIFSDYEEDIAGIRTYDVLRSVRDEIKTTDPDFGIYNRLHELGRQGLLDDDRKDVENGPFGKTANPGWKLDKWKFVPMVDEALQVRPDAKWYIFVEADTYVVWRNLVAWLAKLDWEKPWYLGAPMQIGDIVFAYGGAGIVLSNAAMQKVSKYRAEHAVEVDQLTAGEWAGDCVLGKVLGDLGVPFLWSWPMLQTSRMWEFDHFKEGYYRKPWCYPAVSYHHMAPEDITTMWDFDQQWFENEKSSLLLHGDVFRNLIRNETLQKRDDWDNLSSDNAVDRNNGQAFMSADDCAQLCTREPECLQFSFENGQCLTSNTVIRGSSRAAIQSGWMTERIEDLLRKQSCPKAEYILP